MVKLLFRAQCYKESSTPSVQGVLLRLSATWSGMFPELC